MNLLLLIWAILATIDALISKLPKEYMAAWATSLLKDPESKEILSDIIRSSRTPGGVRAGVVRFLLAPLSLVMILFFPLIARGIEGFGLKGN